MNYHSDHTTDELLAQLDEKWLIADAMLLGDKRDAEIMRTLETARDAAYFAPGANFRQLRLDRRPIAQQLLEQG